jgi:hypothetical protein
MANTNFKIDNGLVANGDSTFNGNVAITEHISITKTLTVNSDLTVVGNLTYSNTSINGSLIPTTPVPLGNTTNRFSNVYVNYLYISNSEINANGAAINLTAQSGIIAEQVD